MSHEAPALLRLLRAPRSLRRSGSLAPILLALMSAQSPAAAFQAQGVTTRVSVDSWGVEGDGYSGRPSISADGRFVAFEDGSWNLVPGNTNGTLDVFVHDRQSGRTRRVSVSSAGGQGDRYSVEPSISADGRFVAFFGKATNLVPGDANGAEDVFVHDRQTGQTSRVSVSSTGVEGNYNSAWPAISGDGRHVAFVSFATNLVPGDVNGYTDIFLHDRQSGRTSLVSVSSTGVQANRGGVEPAITSDGRCVAFASGSTNLVPGDTNGVSDIFVHDRQSGQTTRVSVDSTGVQGDGNSFSPSISADGRYVAFESSSPNLAPGGLPGITGIFVHDRSSGETTHVSVGPAGVPGDGMSFDPSISSEGRYVAFTSYARNLVPAHPGAVGIFVHDLRRGVTTYVSLSSGGEPANGLSTWASISAWGRHVAFESDGSNLVPGDTNGSRDIFVHDTAYDWNVGAYCTAKINSQGCTPAIGWAGFPSATACCGFDVTAMNLLNNKSGMLFYGVHGPAATAFQGGTLCVRPPIRRTSIQDSGVSPPPSNCSGHFRFDFNDLIASGSNPDLTAGQVVNCQYWSRDPQASFGTSLTDAIEFLIGP